MSAKRSYELDKKLLLTLQWACNAKGLKIPWDLVAEQMGPTISPGAVIQHLAKFRTRMVEQGYSVPPPLTRGGSNNGIRAGRDRNIVSEPPTAGPSRRTTKRATKKAKQNEDSENTDQESDQSSEEETFTKRPRKAKGKGKAKRPARVRRAAKEAQQLTVSDFDAVSDSDVVKEEPTSAAEGQYSQARYGVGDSMWDMDGINEAPPKRSRTSKLSSQSSQPSTKMVVLDIGRAGFARLGVSSQAEGFDSSDDHSRREVDDHYSENDMASDHSPMDHTQDNGAAELKNADDLHNQFGVDHRETVEGGPNLGFLQHDGFERDLVAPSSLYSEHFNAVPSFDGKPSTLVNDTHNSSYGDKDRVSHYCASTLGFPVLPNQIFGSATMGKHNQVAKTGYQSHFDTSQQSAFHGYHSQDHPSLSGYGGLPGTNAGYVGNETIGHRRPGREMLSVSQPIFASQASNVRGQQASYSSVDSYRPIGGEYADFPNGSYTETPVAMSRDNSGFDKMASNRRPMTDAGIPWEAFLEPQDDGFGY
ncbi:MAG: hypothetical protein Q9178_005646 [Gyalolechia marmorata]